MTSIRDERRRRRRCCRVSGFPGRSSASTGPTGIGGTPAGHVRAPQIEAADVGGTQEVSGGTERGGGGGVEGSIALFGRWPGISSLPEPIH